MTGPTKRDLENRLDDLEATGDEDIPVTVWLSARPETCVDEERRLHEMGGRLWRFPPDKHAAVMASKD